MSLLSVADSFYVGVHDVDAAVSWYVDKLGMKKTEAEVDDGEGCVGLVFPKQPQIAILVGPVADATNEGTRMLYTGNIKKALEWLISRGVNVGAIEADRQGTHYFAMRDLEGNALEVSEEP